MSEIDEAWFRIKLCVLSYGEHWELVIIEVIDIDIIYIDADGFQSHNEHCIENDPTLELVVLPLARNTLSEGALYQTRGIDWLDDAA